MKIKTVRLVYGVGINDADYVTQRKETIGYVDGKQRQKLVWVCPYYLTWADMLKRCYSTKAQETHTTYKGCSVSEEWLSFSNFRAWLVTQEFEGMQLDKELLVEGNKVYSANTCVFVTREVNMFTVDSRATRGEWLIGVYWNKGKFMTQCRNPFTKKSEYLGRFDCEQEAHQAWLKRKLELAHQLAAIQTDERVAEALINRYTNYVSRLPK